MSNHQFTLEHLVPFKGKSSFRSVVFWKKNLKCNGIAKIGNSRSISKDHFEPKFALIRFILILYGRYWCIAYTYWNYGNVAAIFRAGEFKHPMILWQNVDKSDHVPFRQYMVLERLNVRQNGPVDSEKI